MGVVHLAQAARRLPGRAQGAAPAHRRRRRGAASGWPARSPRCAGCAARAIAEVIDADPWGETPYVATRYVPGLSLHEHVRQEGPVARRRPARTSPPGSPRRCIAVHQVGVLHRDIKPSNVLLEGRSPVLIDFGLARLAEDPRLTAHRLAARHARLPRARDPLRRRRHHGLRRALLGGDRRVRRDRPAAVRHRPGDGDHGPGTPRRARPVRRCRRRCSRWCAACLAPDPADRPGTGGVLASLRGPARADLTLPHVLAPHERLTMPFALAARGPRSHADATDALDAR